MLSVEVGQLVEIDGVRQESREYLNLKVMPFAEVAPQVVFQVSGSNNIPAAVAWYNYLDHRGLFAERSVWRDRGE